MGVVDGRTLTEVGEGRTALRPAQQHGVRASGRPKSELVEREALPPGGDDALPGILREGQGAHAHLGTFGHAHVVRDLAHDDGDPTLLLRHVLGQSIKADGGSVDLGHVQTLGHRGAEFRVGTTGEEFVKLDEEARVGVLGLDDLRRGLVSRASSAGFEIDTHGCLIVYSRLEKGWERIEFTSGIDRC